MRNYTADGRLKLEIEQDAGSTPKLLALGSVALISPSTTGFAASQALNVSSSAVGLAALQAPTSGTALVLTGVAADLRPPRKVTLTSTANLSAINFVIIGLDASGAAATETIAGPNNSTVTGTNSYEQVVSITPSGTSASNVSAGWPTSTDPFRVELDVTTASPSRQVTLTSTSDLSALTFTIVGKDTSGAAQTETITGPNNSTVTSIGYYSSITSVTPGTLGSGSISVGYPATSSVLYQWAATGTLSHVFFKNNNAATQTIEISLASGGVAPVREVSLAQNESGSLLEYEQPVPLPAGAQLRLLTTTNGAVSFTVHGTDG